MRQSCGRCDSQAELMVSWWPNWWPKLVAELMAKLMKVIGTLCDLLCVITRCVQCDKVI